MKAKLQLAQHALSVIRIFFQEFNAAISLDLSIELRPADVIHHKHPPLFIQWLSCGITHNESQCLERWRGCIQGVIAPDVKLAPDKSRTVVCVKSVPFIDINPPDANDLPTNAHLVISSSLLVHSEFVEILHLQRSGCMH